MRSVLLLLVVGSLCGGCVATKSQPGYLNQVLAGVQTENAPLDIEAETNGVAIPEPLVEYVEANKAAGLRDQVLNDMECGLVALEIGEPEYARAALVDAYNVIETVYSDNEAAIAARSKFVPESNKDFKGESHERALLGYYLGLSDMIMHDMENAKVSFKWGEFQDTMSASEDYQSDIALLNFLMGWVDQCNGDYSGAQEHYELVQEQHPEFTIPEDNHNFLMIGETGGPPIKQRGGQYGEELSYVRSDIPTAERIIFKYNNQEFTANLVEDIYWQATTRGGREIDKILAGKAEFKEEAEMVSEVAAGAAKGGLGIMALGAATGNRNLAGAGGIISLVSMGVSLGSKAIAYSTTPEADIRYWRNLPDQVHLVSSTYNGSEGQTETVFFDNADGFEDIEKKADIHQTGSCYLAWSRAITPKQYENWDKKIKTNWVVLEVPTAGDEL